MTHVGLDFRIRDSPCWWSMTAGGWEGGLVVVVVVDAVFQARLCFTSGSIGLKFNSGWSLQASGSTVTAS